MNDLILNKDLNGIRKALSLNPALANEGLPFDEDNYTTAHPLHRLCDDVFTHAITSKEAIEIAQIFLEHGANINGNEPAVGSDTPLTAASSLHAEELGIFYIEKGANIHHAGHHGGTALHWAAWTGRDKLVEKLLAEKADIHKICISFKGTPLLWAVHGYKFGGPGNIHHQVECVRLLLAAGSDKTIPNIDGTIAYQFLEDKDTALISLLK